MNGMVSRRKFISMTMMMVVLLFMFQLTQAVKDMENEYNVNTYAGESILDESSAWQLNGGVVENVSFDKVKEHTYVALLGSRDTQLGSIAQQWCVYTKRNLREYASVEDLNEIKRKKPEVLVIDSEYVNFKAEADDLLKLAESDISMVFCNLPDADVIANSKNLRELLGIQKVQADEVELQAIKLFPGFLLGGEKVYQVQQEDDVKRQDLDMTVPWYVAFGGTKTYMVGLIEDETVKNEYLPALIWRNSHEDAKIFAVNGDYMYDSTGIGILDAMMAELHDYELYPVVNAQNLTVANYPGFAEENTDEMKRRYSRTQRSLFQDIMWPAFASVSGKTHLHETLFFMAQGDYADDREPSDADYVFYLKEIKENEAEAAVSLENRAQTVQLEEKVARDNDFYSQANDGYVFTAGYAGEAQAVEALVEQMQDKESFCGIKTLVQKYDATEPLLSYADENITLQSTTSNGLDYTFSQDLRMRSLQTALGYSNILLDMYEVAWPDDENDSWEKVYDAFSRNVNTFWKPFEDFEKTALSESDKRVRNMMGISYTDRRENDVIYMQVQNMPDEAWFILRTHGESVAEISGAEALELEDGAYLLKITGSVVRIQLELAEGPYFYVP